MINIRKLNGNDLSNYYTKSQCDNKFLPRMDLSTVINDLENQITTLENNTNTHLTTLDGIVSSQNTQINDLNNFSTLIDLNLYKPLLNSGDTKINNLSGLTNLINNSVSTLNSSITNIESQISTLENNTSLFDMSIYQPLVINNDTRINNLYGLTQYVSNAISSQSSDVSLNNFSIDAFMGVVNFDTTLSLTCPIYFSNMIQNHINTNTKLTSLKNISFGNIVFQNQGSLGGSGVITNTSLVCRTSRMFDFHLTLANINSFNSENEAVMIFVPDRILNLFDGRIYRANFITNVSMTNKYNNHDIVNLFLFFRDHITFNNYLFQNLFVPGTDSAAALKLTICFLTKVRLLNPTTEIQPTVTTYRVYKKPDSRLFNSCCGMMLKNLYFIPTVNSGVYNLDMCLSLWSGYEKTIDNLYFANMDLWGQGSFITISGNTSWKLYHTAEATMDHYTTNIPSILSSTDSNDYFFQFLNQLYH